MLSHPHLQSNCLSVIFSLCSFRTPFISQIKPTFKVQRSESRVYLQHFTQSHCSFVSDFIIFTNHYWVIPSFFFQHHSALYKFNAVKVVFTFNPSLRIRVPTSVIPLPMHIFYWYDSPQLPFTIFIFQTSEIQFPKCRINFQHFTECFCSFISYSITYLKLTKQSIEYEFLFGWPISTLLRSST